jgi:hypothetical protein
MTIYNLYIINLIYLGQEPFSDMISEKGKLKDKIDKNKDRI